MDIKAKLSGRALTLYEIVESTIERWSRHKAPMRAAAMSYYFLVTLAPLTLFFLWILTRFVSDVSPSDIVGTTGSLGSGSQVASDVIGIAERYANQVGTSGPLIAAGIAVLGATVLLAQFTAMLDAVWETEVEAPGWLYFLQTRLLALAGLFVVLLGVIAAVVLLVLVNLGTAAISNAFGVSIAVPAWLSNLAGASSWISLGLVTLLLSVAFTWLPRRHIRWRDTLLGSLITALAYLIGQQVLGVYLSQTAIVSAFGAMGSIVALVIWIYYTMQVVLMGAELTRVLVERAEDRREAAAA